MADAGRGAQVGSECGLAVGSRRDEVEPAARGEQAGAVAGHDVPPWYPKGTGGIAMKTSSVSRATSASRSADSHARAGSRATMALASSAGEPEAGAGCTASSRRQALIQAGAGSFKGAVDRFEGHLQHVGHLAGVEAEDVAQDRGRRPGVAAAAAGRSRRPARWPGSARQRASGPGERLDGTLEEGVRKRLQPDGLVARGRHEQYRRTLLPLPGQAPGWLRGAR